MLGIVYHRSLLVNEIHHLHYFNSHCFYWHFLAIAWACSNKDSYSRDSVSALWWCLAVATCSHTARRPTARLIL